MQLSKETVDILKNFAAINNSAVFKKGQAQRTVSIQKTILLEATIEQAFPRDFAIYDLAQFLSVLSLFDNPTLEFGEKNLTIKDAKSTTTYFYAAPENIVQPPPKSIDLGTVDATFTVDAGAMKAAVDAAGVMGLPEVFVSGRDGQAYIGATNTRSDTSNVFEYIVGKTDSNFRMVFQLENIKMMPRTYTVELASKGLAKFTSENNKLIYWIPVSANASSKAKKAA